MLMDIKIPWPTKKKLYIFHSHKFFLKEKMVGGKKGERETERERYH